MAADGPDVVAIAGRFTVEGSVTATAPLGRGHIHDSYLITCSDGSRVRRYVLQRVNEHVFADPAALMHNVERVTRHLRSRLSGQSEPALERRCLALVPTRTGGSHERDARGDCWRAYHYIEGSVTHEAIRSEAQARSAAAAFGAFQRALADLPAPRLRETIPDFHVTPRRLAQLDRAITADTHGRVAQARTEIGLARARQALADELLALHRAGALPERVVHNDTKLNNVLFDAQTDAALCVVDLDTVMPGLAPYDFGDLVRSCTLAREDAPGPHGVDLDLDLYEALLRGYLEGAGDLLAPAERTALPLACRLITYELGVRFLTDYLQGDRYFKIARPDHNLERARVQLALMEAMERKQAAMQRLVGKLDNAGARAPQPR
jgi:Ser/Thr protein kinase RdoA (MazF antagonist)